MSEPTTFEIEPGDDTDIPLQCKVRGGADAIFNAGDTLSAKIFQPGATTAISGSTVAATWYTAGGTQTGYDQGEIVLTPSAATVAALMPSVRYTVSGYRLISGTSRTERIATIRLKVRQQAPG